MEDPFKLFRNILLLFLFEIIIGLVIYQICMGWKENIHYIVVEILLIIKLSKSIWNSKDDNSN
jgi:hypothetical protein